MRKSRRKWIGILLTVLLVVIVVRAFWPLPAVKLVISKQTTYFTGPLNPDGTVNYVAAYKDLVGAGVTPDNNMAVPLLMVLGPSALPDDARDGVLAALDIVLPADAHYFTTLDDHLAANEPEYEKLVPSADEAGVAVPQQTALERLVNRQLQSATERPWSAEEYPILADWLEVNESPLDEIVAAKARSRFFMPVASAANPPMFGWGELKRGRVGELRGALNCRAMLRLSGGDVVGAWEDALTMCRLGRLKTGIGHTALSIDGLGFRHYGPKAVTAIAQKANLTSDQAGTMLREYQTLPRAGSWARAEYLTCRLMALDTLTRAMRGGNRRVVATPSRRFSVPHGFSLDMNDVMRRINEFYDACDEAVSEPEIPKRQETCAELSDANKQLVTELIGRASYWGITKTLLASGRVKRKWVNDCVVGTFLALAPSPSGFVSGDARSEMDHELAHLALALAAYHADHDRYPSALSELAAHYVPTVPKDLISGDDLRYESDGRSYKLEHLTVDAGD